MFNVQGTMFNERMTALRRRPLSIVHWPFPIVCCLCGVLVCAWAGCSSGPTPPERPKFDPAVAAQEAMAKYDTNHDGTLDQKELATAPALKYMLEGIKARDPSHPDSLNAEDIANRVKSWAEGSATIMSGTFTVSLDGEPLEGATITFEPEPWLGPTYKAHTGLTDKSGFAVLNNALNGYHGIYIGLYTVKISKLVEGKETVPEQYNKKTTLGREICADSPFSHDSPFFKLTSKR
jgi:hypothetical protein